MGKPREKGKRRGFCNHRAVAGLGEQDKKSEARTKVDISPRTEEIDASSINKDEVVGEEFEVIEVVCNEGMEGEEYEEELLEVGTDEEIVEEIVEEIEEIVEVEAEELDDEEVQGVGEGPYEVEEQIEDIDEKVDEPEEPSEVEQVEEEQGQEIGLAPDNEGVKEGKCDIYLEQFESEEFEEEIEDENTNEETEDGPSEDKQFEQMFFHHQRASLDKQDHSDTHATERPSAEGHCERKGNMQSSQSVSNPISDSNIVKQKTYQTNTISIEKKVSADPPQIRKGSSKVEMCYADQIIALESGNGETATDKSFLDKQGANISSSKKKRSRWDSHSESYPDASETGDEMVKKRKSRWSSDVNPVKMPDLLEIPHFFFNNNNKTMQDPEIEELVEELKNIKEEFLRVTGVKDSRNTELAIKNGIMEASLRAKFVRQKQQIFSLLLKKGLDFTSLIGGKIRKNGKYIKKIYVPVKEFPDYDFVGLFFGPRGNTHKRMELESGAKIKLRGKGSAKEGKTVKGTSDLSGDEDLHVCIEAENEESFDSAVKMVEKLFIPVAETENELKRAQLRELAALNGKIAPGDVCEVCGDASHYTRHCPLTAGKRGSDGHHVREPVEFSVGLSLTSKIAPTDASVNQLITCKLGDKKIDDRKLFVGQLPFSVDESRLVELFRQYGEVREAQVVKDASTGRSLGYAFVKYRYPADAAKAVKHMHGSRLEGRTLTVQVSGLSTKTPTSADPEKTTGHYKQSSQGSLSVSQLSPIPIVRPAALSFGRSDAIAQHHVNSFSTNVSVLRPVNSSYLASRVPSPATTYTSSADLVNFAGNPDKLPSPISFQMGKSSTSLFSSGAAYLPRHQAAFESHVYPSRAATILPTTLPGPPVHANTIPHLSRLPSLAAPPAESSSFPGNPDSFTSRFL